VTGPTAGPHRGKTRRNELGQRVAGGPVAPDGGRRGDESPHAPAVASSNGGSRSRWSGCRQEEEGDRVPGERADRYTGGERECLHRPTKSRMVAVPPITISASTIQIWPIQRRAPVTPRRRRAHDGRGHGGPLLIAAGKIAWTLAWIRVICRAGPGLVYCDLDRRLARRTAYHPIRPGGVGTLAPAPLRGTDRARTDGHLVPDALDLLAQASFSAGWPARQAPAAVTTMATGRPDNEQRRAWLCPGGWPRRQVTHHGGKTVTPRRARSGRWGQSRTAGIAQSVRASAAAATAAIELAHPRGLAHRPRPARPC
jgi:hypothetical protein